MIPLRDNNPTLLMPYVTIAVILVNVVAWLYLQGAGLSEAAVAGSVCRFGSIPAEIMGNLGTYEGVQLNEELSPCAFGGLTWGAVLTSMFMHGSWLHLIGNLWFLWLFGNNVEDSMGHLRFLVFYLLVGVVGALAHVFTDVGSMIPTVGASGAISGVMGAYLLLYPKIKIQTLFVLLIFIKIIPVPAWLVLGEWFAVQLYSSYVAPAGGSGVAFWAHIGGFVAGLVLIKLFVNPVLLDARKQKVQLSSFEVPGRGWM